MKTKHPISDSIISIMLVLGMVTFWMIIIIFGGFVLFFLIANFVLLLCVIEKMREMKCKEVK